MPFEPGLLQDLDDYERFLTWRNGANTAAADLSAPVMRDLALLHAETMKVAAFAAAATSLATHELAWSGGRHARQARSNVFAATFSAAAEQRMTLLPQSSELFDLHRAWIDVQARLAFANGLAREREAEKDIEPVISLDLIADAWTRACTALLDWHERLAALLPDGHPVAGGRDGEAEALGMLRQAAAGGTTCIDADGLLTLPGWAERRRDKRRTTSIAATILFGLDTLDCRIEDMSRGGLQVALDAHLPVDTPVALMLPAGRMLTGAVRWSGEGRLGVEFEHPLADDDPVLAVDLRAAGH